MIKFSKENQVDKYNTNLKAELIFKGLMKIILIWGNPVLEGISKKLIGYGKLITV